MQARLRRIDEDHGLSPVLGPEALREARELAESQDEGDVDAQLTLGAFHWCRYLALPEGEDQADLVAAAEAFVLPFVFGIADLPESLLPLLAGAAFPLAIQMSQLALASPDTDVVFASAILWQRIAQATPTDDPNRPGRLTNLGHALQARFGRTGSLEDLDTAIAAMQEALETAPASHPDRAMMLSNSGDALRLRFEQTGSLEDLDTAIAAMQEALETAPASHPDRAGRLSTLGLTLLRRFERTGSLEDLDTAIAKGQESVATIPANHPDRAMWLSNLGLTLQTRFERTGSLEDLDTAIAKGQESVATIPANHPDRAKALSTLGTALLRRFERTGSLEDLNTAIDHHRNAVTTTPANHPERPLRLSQCANALQARFERTGSLEDLNTAIDHHRNAVTTTPANHPGRAMWLSNLGNALKRHSERTGSLEELNTAIDHYRNAVTTTPANHPGRAMWLSNLGNALQARFGQTSKLADLDEAASLWLEASKLGAAAPSVRIETGMGAAYLLAESGDATKAAEIAEAAIRLLPQVAPRRLKRGDQQHAIGGFAGLAGTAAALALAAPGGTTASRAERALELLEAGRSVLLSQALEVRSDLTDLRENHPELARRFAELREQLDAPERTLVPVEVGNEIGGLGLQQERLVRDRQWLEKELTALLAEIRNRDGFSTFALPPTTDQLLSQASQGPVVVFNINGFRSDALLLTNEGIANLQLPHLTPNKVIDQINLFRRALRMAVSREDSSAERERAQAKLVEILQWLWDVAAGPVLEELGRDAVPSAEDGSCEEGWPRVWWSPGGLLSLLPLHAAGYHTDAADDPHRRTVMDRVVSSYTPTVRALRYARERTLSPTVVRSLIVAMPTTPGLPRHGQLRFVEAEATMLQARLPDPVLLQEPAPADGPVDPTKPMPTKANVLEYLPECAIVHFACHGASNPTDPSKSQLLLHDHADNPMTVASLGPVALDQARLAYLSACRTAAIDTAALLDAAIHLTSAFQLAGFPHVIGTLWEIDDGIAVTIADLFYAALQTGSGLDPDRAAHALHRAVRRVRDGHGLPAPFDRRRAPLLWAAYLHAGA
ncbi:CHAT domain-containing tetratricopeptide repeat protein [Streptomyces pseudovenezuelae]|uniref:CHAT domain-containing tetratricopeptide repeat protein n=1 Tax=Streptomyces pseudovenezuelae TaxID=67350 RepID=UPI0036ED53B7